MITSIYRRRSGGNSARCRVPFTESSVGAFDGGSPATLHGSDLGGVDVRPDRLDTPAAGGGLQPSGGKGDRN
ncbi:hypothetical protein BSLG_001980 [Batrachochytrium salamandrivorans]|nr:hypothetical protein BSLG_001980 [Batrachochytrium salamandrivorans]